MFKKNKEKGNSKDTKEKTRNVKFDENFLVKIDRLMPLANGKDNIYSQYNTFSPNNPEFEVWRAVKDNKNNKNQNKNNKNDNLILTEYLVKSNQNKNAVNSIQTTKIGNNYNNQEGINVIEDYFDKGQEFTPNENNNIDEDYSDNSDKEIDQKIHKQREIENDDDDDEDETNYTQTREKRPSKKSVNNNKLMDSDDDEGFKAESPYFTTDCKFYGENKEKYKVKIIIDSSFCIYFIPQRQNNFKNYNENFYQFPLLSIKNYITTKKKGNYIIDLILKDYRHFLFKLFTLDDFNKFNNIIKKFGMPDKSTKYFRHAFYHFNEYSKKEKNQNYVNGWEIYNDEEEFKSQQLDFKNTFRIVDNSKFDFCSSYPKKIIVPISMSDEDIRKCGTYRTKERIPALTYRYDKNGRCIWRSSQTKSGIKGKTNKDVILLTKIAEGAKKLYVFDARPLLNAWANKLKGAGYEDISQYQDINMELIFCGIPNIHAVRGSCHKVYSTLCYKNENEDKKTKAKNLDSGNWYDSIIILIKGAFQIAEAIKDNNTVLIHCSDGWDRTTQLSCTSQIILDKRFRTLNGFICLIEKDWLSFGHQFRYRCGMYYPGDSPSNVASENQKSPIFIQWLDAIYQIMNQNMRKFEFNTDLLYFLASEMFTGKYGTFLFNNEQEREIYNAREKTISIWTYVKENEFRFINPIYEEKDNNSFVMNYKRIQLWTKYFYRFEEGDNCYNEIITKVVKDLNNKNNKNIKMIDELINFIKKECPKADISSLSKDCQKLINNNK